MVLVDIVPDLPQGKALDLLEAGPVLGYDTLVTGTNDYDETANSDLIVITSGIARKPGMSRDDLIRTNQQVVAQVTREVAPRSPNAILLVVTNPADAMAQLAFATSSFPKQRVLGLAGVLDAARFRTFIAQEMGVSVRDVHAYVIGGHGDTMVPLARFATVAGIPVPQLLSEQRLAEIVQHTRDGGAEIVALLKQGSAYYAPSASVLQMIDAIVLDQQRILPCSVYLQGEYGISDVFVGVPAKLGAKGVEEVIQYELTDGEHDALLKSVHAVRALIEKMQIG